MTITIEQCADELVRLSTFSKSKVDNIVDEFLVGFGRQTSTKRMELADTVRRRMAGSELSESILRRVLRDPN